MYVYLFTFFQILALCITIVFNSYVSKSMRLKDTTLSPLIQ